MCVENTLNKHRGGGVVWNYLRVRGEYIAQSYSRKYYMELPPRARRIPAELLRAYRIRGTTSACAENTEGGLQYRGPLGTTSACAENT